MPPGRDRGQSTRVTISTGLRRLCELSIPLGYIPTHGAGDLRGWHAAPRPATGPSDGPGPGGSSTATDAQVASCSTSSCSVLAARRSSCSSSNVPPTCRRAEVSRRRARGPWAAPRPCFVRQPQPVHRPCSGGPGPPGTACVVGKQGLQLGRSAQPHSVADSTQSEEPTTFGDLAEGRPGLSAQ